MPHVRIRVTRSTTIVHTNLFQKGIIMNTRRILNISGLILACCLFCFQAIYEDGREIIDPSVPPSFNSEIQELLSEQETWQAFQGTFGDDWDISWDEQTSTPRIIYGGTIPVIGGLNDQSIESSCNNFLSILEPLSLVDAENFELADIRERENRWIIRYAQKYLGLHVEGSELSLLVNPLSQIVRLRASIFSEIDIQVQSQISTTEALIQAQATFGYTEGIDRINSTDLIIYPTRTSEIVSYILAYKIDLSDGENNENWVYYIDANQGSTIAAFNNTTSASVEGTVTGYIYREYPTDTKVVESWADGWVTVNTSTDVTDASGDYTIYVGNVGQYTVNSSMIGSHIEIIDDEGPELSHSGTAYTWMDHNWSWNSSGSYSAESDDEVNVWYHLTLMYELVKAAPFNFDMMTQDYFQEDLEDNLEVHVRFTDEPYGSFERTTGVINLGEGNTQNTNSALDTDWIYHEMGHAVHCSILGSSAYGYLNDDFRKIKEAVSDYWACTINGSSGIFEVTKPSSGRDLDNDWIWGDANCDGEGIWCWSQYVSGGLWDMRGSLGVTIADRLFFETLFEAAHFVTDFLDDILIQDDIYYGDGNGIVTISTPHIDDILYAFGDHGIYPATASIPPARPINVALHDMGDETRISWNGLNDDTNSDFDYFIVYRKTSPDIGGGPKPVWRSIGTTTALYFDDEEFEMEPNGPMTAWYKVRTKDDTGNYSAYSELVTSDGYGVASKSIHQNSGDGGIDLKSSPTDFMLENNFPNPFNPSTMIKYGLPTTAKVQLIIYDAKGRKVKTLANSIQPSGWHQRTWDGMDEVGRIAPTGVYICSLTAGKDHQTLKILLMR